MVNLSSAALPSEEELEFKRTNLPLKPGVYIYKDKDSKIIYVGKAKSLRNRVNSYWKERSKSEDPIYAQKITRLVAHIRDLEVFVVDNETEALLLENELIKKNQPIYNVMLKDDKSYPWVQITNEAFPRIRIIRGPERYGLQHKYIGPFVDGYDLKKTIRFIRKIFPFCTCKKTTSRKKRTRPCVYYQIKLCPGPCFGYITEEKYNQNIRNIELLLTGEIKPIQSMMKTKMEKASTELAFEEAVVWRDRLQALEQFTIEQSILSYDLADPEENSSQELENADDSNQERLEGRTYKKPLQNLRNLDVIAGHYSKKRAGIVIIHVRYGRVLGKTPYVFDVKEKLTSKTDYILSLLKQHYLRPDIPLPDEIVLETQLPSDIETGLLTYFSTRETHPSKLKISPQKRKPVKFRLPSEVDKTAGLIRIAKKNIELLISQKDEYEQHQKEKEIQLVEQSKINQGLRDLQTVLELDDVPLIIEGFDMAHLQGTDYTGSMVCLVEGRPSKKHYRRYKVRTVDKPDDIAAMKEVMTRRYTRAIKESTLPDLVVVDGGKGQLNMAHKLFVNLGIDYVPHIGLVKPEGRSEIYKTPRIVIPDEEETLQLPKNSPALHLIQHLRDESHRFANAYHRKLRNKRQTKSELDEIPGIGPARKKKLLQLLGSVAEIKRASEETLGDVIGPALAKTVFEHFQQKALEAQKKPKKKKYKLTKKKK
ncbi:GIY-YIG nuclease family protein [Candidatus Lokiarchaeum ossiferum]|uniref:GIY-YIG nuclease family protein n=1 Tax=Candidatus Lokiarchaeum ossiferum TaxID=2951803 RepID=UPI00352F6D48